MTPARLVRAARHRAHRGQGESIQATVRIHEGTLEVEPGLVGDADVLVSADAQVWLDIVSKKRSAVWAVLTGRLRTTGDRSLLDRFAACFPR